MESHPSDQTPLLTGDAESKRRRNLGIDGISPPSSSSDPLKGARQAIRAQVTAREYTERQLAQAQTAIQELRTKLRHVHQEKETAISAAQSAMMARDIAERTMRAAETALVTGRANRARTEGMLRDAEATIRDLREKLATANQNLRDVHAELDAERQVRRMADDAPLPVIAVVETVVATVQEVIAPIVRRPVGRPRKIALVEPVEGSIGRLNEPPAPPEHEAASNRDAGVPAGRRPVGRPRKMAAAPQPIGEPANPPKKVPTLGKSTTRIASSRADDQEPIQWWVEGWNGR